jgi:pimeloyl-ACP methyl ester carboxylesterase
MLRFFAILVCLLFASGCNSYVANKLVQAPNHDSQLRGVDASASELTEHHVAKQLRIDVGPPPASLSVWVVEPITGHGRIELEPGRYQPTVHLVLDSKSEPTTQLAPTQPAPTPRGTLFLLSGLGDGKDEGPYEFYSFALASEGYRIILVDHRGHGRSTGDRISYGSHESRDMVQVLDTLEKRGLIEGEVGVVGVSYGGAVAICWAAIDPRVRTVVAIEPFASLRDALSDAGPMMLGASKWMFSKDDYVNIMQRMGKIDGFDPDRDSPLYAISHSTTPVLLIHGTADDFVRPIHSQRLHEAAPDHTKLIFVDGADHFNLWFKGLDTIMKESNDWLGRYLVPPASAAVPSKTREKIN